MLGKNLAGSVRDKVNTASYSIKWQEKKTVFCYWEDLRVMRARQFCTENDPFANTVFLKKKNINTKI